MNDDHEAHEAAHREVLKALYPSGQPPTPTRVDWEEQVRALDAVVRQYKASMERFERLGRACKKWAASMPKDRLFGIADLDLHGAIDEWLAGEPKDVKEAR